MRNNAEFSILHTIHILYLTQMFFFPQIYLYIYFFFLPELVPWLVT